ncbi:MAG: sialate O-acetylesterase [Fibrobacter sp.]|nr:sialate O-acetylesterase [Fibrobacter sp.]
MVRTRIFAIAALTIGISAAAIFAEPSENFKVFLCFGQSNMSGGSGVMPSSEDGKTHDRVMTLAFNDCQQNGWQKDKWYNAKDPLHCGDGINAIGPAYSFGKALADSLPGDTIGLVPCGQWGVSIAYFMKGGFYNDSKPGYPGGTNVYDWMLKRCKTALERGVFSGIILLQGESNSGQQDWADNVKKIYDDLKTDLAIKSDIPIVVGELLHSGCCGGHNSIIAKIPEKFPEGLGYVASAEGLSGGGTQPQYHFNAEGYREMGKRFAVEMLKGLRYIGTSIRTPKVNKAISSVKQINSTNAKVYSLDGRLINTNKSSKIQAGKFTPGIYISGGSDNITRLLLVPND